MATHWVNRNRTGMLCLCFALAAASMLLSGCDAPDSVFVLSLQPSYTSADLQSDQGLEGSWTTTEGDVTFCFEPAEHKEYKVTVKETNGGRVATAEFEGHLIRIGAFWFLDFLPNTEAGGSEFYQMHLFRAHSIARIEVSRDNLQMAFFDSRWLQEKIDEKSVDMSFQKTDGTLLLTGTTEEVQDLLFLHGNDDGAFPDPITLTRPEAQQ